MCDSGLLCDAGVPAAMRQNTLSVVPPSFCSLRFLAHWFDTAIGLLSMRET